MKCSECKFYMYQGEYRGESVYMCECDMPDEDLPCHGEWEPEDEYTPSATAGDYSPSNPWNAPGMSVSDFI